MTKESITECIICYRIIGEHNLREAMACLIIFSEAFKNMQTTLAAQSKAPYYPSMLEVIEESEKRCDPEVPPAPTPQSVQVTLHEGTKPK